MNKVLFVVSSLEPSGPARQLCLLAPSLPPGAARVCVLGPPSPWCDSLQRAGVPVDVLGWRRLVDLSALRRLREILRAEPDARICAWGPGAGWPVIWSGAASPERVTAVAPLDSGEKPSAALAWLLRRQGRVVPLGQAEAARCRQLGVAESRMTVVPPGVPLPSPAPAGEGVAVPEDARVILTPGPIGRFKGQRESIWVLDILGYLYPNLHLVLPGALEGTEGLSQFVRACHREQQIHFPGVVPDLAPWLARAELVWLPCLRSSSRLAALEAMAAGKPVVGSAVPALGELIEDGQTGLLAPPGDKATLAKLTRQVLEDADLQRRLGEAAREHVRRHHSLEQHAAAMREVLG